MLIFPKLFKKEHKKKREVIKKPYNDLLEKIDSVEIISNLQLRLLETLLKSKVTPIVIDGGICIGFTYTSKTLHFESDYKCIASVMYPTIEKEWMILIAKTIKKDLVYDSTLIQVKSVNCAGFKSRYDVQESFDRVEVFCKVDNIIPDLCDLKDIRANYIGVNLDLRNMPERVVYDISLNRDICGEIVTTLGRYTRLLFSSKVSGYVIGVLYIGMDMTEVDLYNKFKYLDKYIMITRTTMFTGINAYLIQSTFGSSVCVHTEDVYLQYVQNGNFKIRSFI